jgi:uncharacterized damage-inducible protein DinB
MNTKELFLIQKANEHKGTIAVYSKIPQDRLDWRPVEGLLSLGQLARHVGMAEEGTRRIAIDNDWSYYDKRVPLGLFSILGEVKSLDAELEHLERVHQETMRAAEALPMEKWSEIRESEKYKMSFPIGVFLFRIIEHQTHHRAQVGTYLRILTGERASPYAL